jgi:hypothetical protein
MDLPETRGGSLESHVQSDTMRLILDMENNDTGAEEWSLVLLGCDAI